MDRAQRRAHIQRLKKSRRNYWSRDKSLNGKELSVVAHTPKLCSCWMCGNPRKYSKERTLQERRLMQGLD